MVLSQATISPATVKVGGTFTVTSILTPEASMTGIVAELWGRINQGSWVKAATKSVGNVTINVPVTISIPCPANQAGAAEVYIKVYQSTNPPPTGPFQDSPHATFTITENGTPPPPPPFPWMYVVAGLGAVAVCLVVLIARRRKK